MLPGSVGGGGQQRAEWQDIVVKRTGDLNLKARAQHPASRSLVRMCCSLLLVRIHPFRDCTRFTSSILKTF